MAAISSYVLIASASDILNTERETQAERKARGAFYTPDIISDYLAHWAIAGRPSATVLDPSCGDGAFLRSAARTLLQLGGHAQAIGQQLQGFEVAPGAAQAAVHSLTEQGVHARIGCTDFTTIMPPTELFGTVPKFDAVVGNPPYIRYQLHRGQSRRNSVEAALRQGVRLSGLASSWAGILVHSAAFLKPEGRLAMVLPAELLSVGYAEPIRKWLRERFAGVRLVLFEQLQFEGALENVVLLMASGSGHSRQFSMQRLTDADELCSLREDDAPRLAFGAGKWNRLLVAHDQHGAYESLVERHFVPLSAYGSPTLGTVTGANGYFTLNDETRSAFGLIPGHVRAITPPGTRHLRGFRYPQSEWESARDLGQPVWLLCPDPADRSPELTRYLALGEQRGIAQAYKCRTRTPWWRPPWVEAPDLFFTYMSHRFPRLIANLAGVSFVNSMHGVRLAAGSPTETKEALPLLALNSLTMLGGELQGRSYGGGVLKMEPKEAGTLPVPNPEALQLAWRTLEPAAAALDAGLRRGDWEAVRSRVDQVLLAEILRIPGATVLQIRTCGDDLRRSRLSRSRAA